MKNLDYKVIGVALFLAVIAILSYYYWTPTSDFIMRTLESRILTFLIWLILAVTSIIHFYKNKQDNKNLISDNEGLDKPINYLQFIFTFGAIGTSIQVLSRETFANYNFLEKARCSDYSGFDNIAFIIVIAVLISYSYAKIKPVVQETYIVKRKVRRKDENLTDEHVKN